MVAIGHWKDGVIDEEWLFRDNRTFMKQIDLAGEAAGKDIRISLQGAVAVATVLFIA